MACTREYWRGKYHCTIDLLFDWFRLVCFANKNKNCQLSNTWFQTSPTGGKWYSDTSPFSIPCLHYKHVTIVNDDCSVISKWRFKLTDDARVIIYNCNMFIIQATRLSKLILFYKILVGCDGAHFFKFYYLMI